MGIKLRSKLMLLFMSLAMVIALPATALADGIKDDVVGSAPSRTITAGESTTVNYHIQGNGNDGCNVDANNAATVTINKPAGVSSDKNQLTFTKCKENNNENSQSVTFSSNTANADGYTISVSVSGGIAGNNGWSTTDAQFKLYVNAAPVTNTKPVLSLPANITEEATSAAGAVVKYNVSATDTQDGALNPNCSPASGSTFSLGSTQVNCSVTDSGGLSDSGSFTVTVRDTTAPQLTVPSSPIVVEATSASGAAVNFASQVSAQDAVDSNPQVSCNPASGSTFSLGTTQVSCTATDSANNTSAAKAFDVTVRDTTAPTLSNVPSDMNKTATSASGAVVNYTNPTASDAVDSNPQVNCNPASGSTFSLGTTQVSCTATDSANNTSAASTFKVNVTYGVAGILQPINGGLTLGNHSDDSSAFKVGSTVPVKFQLSGDSADIDNATANIRINRINSNAVGEDLEAVTTSAATTGSLFRYDATSGQYIYNWGTKGLSVGTYQLRIDLGDGNVSHTVWVSLRK